MTELKLYEYGYGPKPNNEKEWAPVEWIILEGNLMISREPIYSSIYDGEDGTTYENSELRRNLLHDFLHRVNLGRHDLLPVGIGPCGSDCVTILSREEMEHYLPEKEMRAYGGADFCGEGCWLRAEKSHRGMCCLWADGAMEPDDYVFPASPMCVRPVIRIR